jgi:hypothetical protein
MHSIAPVQSHFTTETQRYGGAQRQFFDGKESVNKNQARWASKLNEEFR